MLWGSWDTAAGFKPYGVNAVEIRCNRQNERCIEAYASILHHSEGEDLEAQVFSYEIAEWTEHAISATALMPDADCVARVLSVDLPNGPASLELLPDRDACEFEASTAKLVGDPL